MFRRAERRKWPWVLSSLLVSFVRHDIRGVTPQTWAGYLALAYGSFCLLVAVVAVVESLDGAAALLVLPVAVSMYLGLHTDEWTEPAATSVRQRATQPTTAH